jgi:hypothetical protein
MSDHEFENYLTLLTSLLRLDGKQRRQIEKELRAHLEDRLDELASQGMPHDEAVQRALGEFGDAAGLAASFANVSRGRKRRWLMRVTTFSIAATLLIAAGIFTFWPGRNAGPGAAAVVAQAEDPFADPAGKAKRKAKRNGAGDPFAAGPAEPATAEKPSAASMLEEKLNQPTTLDPVELPLQDLVAQISDMHSFPILLNAKKLEEVGVNLDTPITKRVVGLRLRTALDIILDQLELAYTVHDEYVMITTKEDAQSRLEIRVYDCRDLLASKAARKTKPAATDAAPADPAAAPAGGGFSGAYAGDGAMPGGGYSGGEMSGMPGGYGGMGMGHASEHDQRAQRLINILITNVDDQSWLMGVTAGTGPGLGYGEGGGEEQPKRGRGTISEYDGLIVVTQTAQTHRKIEHVLDMLRRASGLDSSKAVKVVR